MAGKWPTSNGRKEQEKGESMSPEKRAMIDGMSRAIKERLIKLEAGVANSQAAESDTLRKQTLMGIMELKDWVTEEINKVRNECHQMILQAITTAAVKLAKPSSK